MARPINKLTPKNFYAAKSYFHRLLQKQQLIEDFNQHFKAEKAFNALPSVDYKDIEGTEGSAIEALQAWIDQYAAHKWPNFLALQRQYAFKKKNHMRAIVLHMQAYLNLKWYAEKVNLSLSEAIEKLAKAELDKIEQAEQEQRKRNSKS